MLIEESRFIKVLIEGLPGEKLTILNFGSQKKKRLKEQPYIYENIILPVLKKNHHLINLDLYEDEGVDIIGDIMEDDVFRKLKDLHINVLFLFNVLEHVTDIKSICARLQEIMPSGAKIFISVPHSFPRHDDPIDNLWRPSPSEIVALFPNFSVIKAEIVEDTTYLNYLFSSVKFFTKDFIRLLMPFYRYSKWKNCVVPQLRWCFKNFSVSIVALEKH